MVDIQRIVEFMWMAALPPFISQILGNISCHTVCHRSLDSYCIVTNYIVTNYIYMMVQDFVEIL